jgi:hypothetical protein
MSFLNHVHIISPVTNCERKFIEIIFDEFDNLSFLFGGNSAANNRLAVSRHRDKFLHELILSEYSGEAISFDKN